MISSHQIYFIIAGIFISTFITQKASAYNTAGFPFTAINEKGDYNDEIEAGIKDAIDQFKSTQTW